jgi:hypothetical protein
MYTHLLRRFVISSALLVIAFPLAAQSCTGVDQNLTPERRALYGPLTAEKAGGDSIGKPVNVQSFMSMGDWVAVFATPTNAERGVFFFQIVNGKPVAKDVWGGVSDGLPASKIADWTKQVDPKIPRVLSMCFARAVVAGR